MLISVTSHGSSSASNQVAGVAMANSVEIVGHCPLSTIEFVILNSVDEVTDMVNMTLTTMFTNTTQIQAASDSHNWGKSAAGGAALVLFDYFLTLDAETIMVTHENDIFFRPLCGHNKFSPSCNHDDGSSVISYFVGIMPPPLYPFSSQMYLLLDVKIGSGTLLFNSLFRGRGIVVTAFAPTNALMALRLHNLFRDTKYIEHGLFIVAYSVISHHSQGTIMVSKQLMGCFQVTSGNFRVLALTAACVLSVF
ncbi:hypothetical protein BU17DRAFT_63678 [Hysterangium stoloniferum]|nr:hypothetical protein BU17DRAFT_63678 [Hysterangium stoloniferum]